MFEIECKKLTPERKKELERNEVAIANRALRVILVVAGAGLVYLGFSEDFLIPGFGGGPFWGISVLGVLIILFAVFAQTLIKRNFFSKTEKNGCFPDSVIANGNDVIIRNVNGEKLFFVAELKKIEDAGSYLKLSLPRGKTLGVYLFKEDFKEGSGFENAEAFVSLIASDRKAE